MEHARLASLDHGEVEPHAHGDLVVRVVEVVTGLGGEAHEVATLAAGGVEHCLLTGIIRGVTATYASYD